MTGALSKDEPQRDGTRAGLGCDDPASALDALSFAEASVPRARCFVGLFTSSLFPNERDPAFPSQVRLAYDQSAFGLYANIALGALLATVLGPVVSQAAMWSWFGVLVLLTLGRGLLYRQYFAASTVSQQDSRWARWFVAGATAAGATWGFVPIFLFPFASVPHQLYLVFIFSGMVAGGVMALPALREAFFGYLVCLLAPLIVRYGLHDGALSPYIAAAALMFGAFMLVTSCKTHRMIVGSLRLRHENRQLVASLVTEKREQERLNVDLQNQVVERQEAQEALRAANEGLEQRVANRTAELTKAVRLLEDEVHERVHAQYSLRLSEARYRMLYDDTPSMYFTVEASGTILSVNRFGAEQLGYQQETLVGRSVVELCPKAERAELERHLRDSMRAKGAVRSWDVSQVRKDGAVIAVRQTARMVPQPDSRDILLLVCEDITERNRLEQQFRQAQKMEAIGKLTGGIAHDFNNLLTVIRGYSDLSREDADAPAPVRMQLDAIGQAVDRATTLTQQLLTFSRQQVVRPKVLDLNHVVSHVEGMLRRVISAHLEFICRPAESACWIKADAGQLEQVLMNLVVNASDAMPRGGRLTIAVERVRLTAADRQAGNPLPIGPAVELCVSDTGCGMDAATQARIFEPFFTTKPIGKGTGLGLSTVYGIVQQSGGHVTVSSRLGQGTVFHLYFPEVAPGVERESVSPVAVDVPHGRERLLVVEDDPMVRQLAVEVLRGLGYDIVQAGSGGEALTVLEREQAAAPVTLVVTDMVMPGMNGRELVEAIHVRYPGLKTLFMSGYTDNEADRRRMSEGIAPYLPKPFTPAMLAQAVRDTLDGRVSEILA